MALPEKLDESMVSSMDDRRSTRMSVVLPVMLGGTDFGGLVFKENTWTIGVNKHGAKLSTSYRLSVGDEIMVGNPTLGHFARARVMRVAEKGRGFEIGVELFEPQDVWGAKNPPEDWMETVSVGGGDGKVEGAAASQVEGVAEAGGAADGPSPQAGAQAGEQMGGPSPRSGQGAGRAGEEGARTAFAREAASESLGDFLRACRAELQGLLTKTEEIQQRSWQTVQSLLEEVHVRLERELAAASASFVHDTRQRVEQEASVALEVFGKEASARQAALVEEVAAQSQAARQKIEVSLQEGGEEAQKKLGELSRFALGEFEHKGEALFENFRNKLQKTLEELKKKGVEEVSEHLREVRGELATELRRRAEVGFEILNDQLGRAGKLQVEETQKHIAALSQSALAALTQEASEAVHQQVGFGASVVKDMAEQTRAGLESYFQQSSEAFRKQMEEMSEAALEKNRKVSQFLLHDLQDRLDQAARALQQISKGAAGGD